MIRNTLYSTTNNIYVQDILAIHSYHTMEGIDTKTASEKTSVQAKHLEDTVTEEGNLIYDGEEEPEIHMRTWIALASMFVLNLVQVFALQGPPAVVGISQLHGINH